MNTLAVSVPELTSLSSAVLAFLSTPMGASLAALLVVLLAALVLSRRAPAETMQARQVRENAGGAA